MELPGNRRTILASIGLLVVLVTAFSQCTGAKCSGNQSPEDRKVAIIVVDGADRKVVEKLQAQDELPHLTRMQEEGVRTELEAPRAFSPVSWTKMATGMSKDNISLERTWSYSGEERTGRLDSRAIEKRRFWSYMNEEGVETGIYHWLLSWPVEEVDGFMISGVMTGDTGSMNYPENMSLSDEEIRSSLKGFNEFDGANRVIDEYRGVEVLALGVMISDRVQHNFWKFLDEDSEETQKHREVIYRSYRETDRLVERLRPEYTVIVVGDHGFRRVEDITYEARLLQLSGKLNLTYYSNNHEKHMANNWDFSQESPVIQRLSRNRVINRTHYRIEFEWVNRDVSRESIRERLEGMKVSGGKNFLQNLRYEDGYFIAEMYLDPERMGEGQYREQYTHLVYHRGEIPTYDRAMNVTYDGKNYTAWLGPEKSGDHTPGTDSVFFAAGDPIKSTGVNESGSVEMADIAPLLLYLKGLEVPRDMDGEVPTWIIEDSYLREHPVRYSDAPVEKSDYEPEPANRTEEQRRRVENRLSELGYLN